MKSIRLHLVFTIVATLVLYNFVATLRGYQGSMREAESLFDNQLLDLSQLVANLDVERIDHGLPTDNNLAFQIWQGDRLLAASGHAPAQPIGAFTAGFDFANFADYRWRTYTRLDESSGRWIIVAERTDLRFLLAENVVLESIAPILFGIPLAALLIWIVVGFGLRPLNQLSDELRVKRVQDLNPLPPGQTPRELDQVVQSINSFIQRLGAALEREKRFASDAAHELRTPISALKIQLHNLAQDVDSGSESFVQLQQGVERLQHLVEQLLSLYRSSSEQFAAQCQRLDLLAVTQDVVARHYPLVEQKHHFIEIIGTACFITGDRFALDTLISNLLMNAIRYTPDGGRILLQLERRAGRECLIIEDNGPGIAEDQRELVFERFYRGGASAACGNGCGLGLTIVRHVADLHNATVTVGASRFATGTSFTVCFPETADASQS